MYQLNNNYSDNQGLELVNPIWQIHNVIDNYIDKSCIVSVLFTDSEGQQHSRTVAAFDYTDTWEDSNVLEAILKLDQFKNSTEIE